MLRFINKIYKKIGKTVYHEVYIINLENLKEIPNFDNYNLNELGNWLQKKSSTWVCNSDLPEDKFKQKFFDLTNFSKEDVDIIKDSWPFTPFLGM